MTSRGTPSRYRDAPPCFHSPSVLHRSYRSVPSECNYYYIKQNFCVLKNLCVGKKNVTSAKMSVVVLSVFSPRSGIFFALYE